MCSRAVALALALASFGLSGHAQPPDNAGGTPHFWPGERVAPQGEAPTELGGFRFGDRERAVRRACERAGHTWDEDDGRLRCGGTARDVGFPAEASFAFCEGRLCEVQLQLDPARVSDKVHWAPWAVAYGVIVRAMRSAFGREVTGNVRGPAGCAEALDEARSAACFAGDGRARHYWTTGGFEIALRLERSRRPHHRAPELTVLFQSPARVAERSRTSD